MDQKTWLKKNGVSLKGKTVAITGATGGLGKEICRGVLFLGGSLLLLNRSQEKTEVLKSSLLREFPEAEISFLALDLQNMDSVQAACLALKARPPQILLHNAGIYDVPRHPCSTGLDNIFQVNFASPYYLTCQLLPELRKQHGRVVVVGSIAHTYAKTDPADPDFHTRSQCHLAYGNSKRWLMYAFSELFREEKDVEFSIGHPGITLTNISDHYPPGLFPLVRPFLRLFFMKNETACRGILYGICHGLGSDHWCGPRYFSVWGSPRVSSLSSCSFSERREISEGARILYEQML